MMTDRENEPRILTSSRRAEVADVARRTAERIERILRAHGRSLAPELQDDEPPALVLEEPGLAACYAAAAQGLSVTGEREGQPTLRLVVSQDAPASTSAADASDEPVAALLLEAEPSRQRARQATRRRPRPQTARAA